LQVAEVVVVLHMAVVVVVLVVVLVVLVTLMVHDLVVVLGAAPVVQVATDFGEDNPFQVQV
jgi:hypothetical protein